MKNQKSLTNKGFSLVELIIVVAIMAVLIGVLAPQYLRYVEKSRLQRDNTSIGELANVVKMASAEESVVEAFATATGDQKITFKADGTLDVTAAGVGGGTATINGIPAALSEEITKTIDPSEIALKSNTYLKRSGAAATDPVMEIVIEVDTDGKMSVTTDDWMPAPDKGPEDKTF